MVWDVHVIPVILGLLYIVLLVVLKVGLTVDLAVHYLVALAGFRNVLHYQSNRFLALLFVQLIVSISGIDGGAQESFSVDLRGIFRMVVFKCHFLRCILDTLENGRNFKMQLQTISGF